MKTTTLRYHSCLWCLALSLLVLQELTRAFSIPTQRLPLVQNLESSESFEVSDSPTTRKYRDVSHSIASKFVTRDFKPHPALTNRHIQTISGVYLRSLQEYKYVSDSMGLIRSVTNSVVSSVFAGNDEDDKDNIKNLLLNPDHEGFYDERQRFETPDGDFFDVDFRYQHASNKPSSKGMVILLHGLQSNSQSTLSVDMATAYWNQGLDVACMNFRGCSGEMNRKMGGYHLGFTNDVKQFLQHLRERNNGHFPLYLSGFSLGANVVLKTLGELGETAHRDFNVYGAAVCGAPFDQERNVDFLQAPGFNRLVYTGTLAQSIKTRSLQQFELFKGSDEWKKIDLQQIIDAETIADLENAVLAPIYGFDDYIDYYRKNSCLQFLDNITVPTFIINAADDPFFDPSVFPWEKSSDFNKNSPIKMQRTDHGGHLGFMFHQEQGRNDMERIGIPMEASTMSKQEENASWMPTELARFVGLVFEERAALDEVVITSNDVVAAGNHR
ncbi:Putative esterase YheT [Seminavis robusta]|uniref:Esterase YheT n=1 Tax=Seminavis robusta TaxID=568900 RepID=A0A9N8HG79_9STRA|nr:Putative esterase YheT [Seminavis robusta]|eukprot:Sro470_g149430.1 Putative esterase YheT (498) ;mRNA; f:8573-10066